MVLYPLSRGPWGRFQCHHHPPRMLCFQRHSRGSFGQSLYIPDSHPSVRTPPPPPPPGVAPLCSAVHQKVHHMHRLKCLLSSVLDVLYIMAPRRTELNEIKFVTFAVNLPSIIIPEVTALNFKSSLLLFHYLGYKICLRTAISYHNLIFLTEPDNQE